MMSRRNTLPSLSSSRQMMMAWKVSGLSHRPAIIASRPASMRLAFAFAGEQFDRTHLAQIQAHGIVGALAGHGLLGLGRRGARDLDELAVALLFFGFLARLFGRFLGLGFFGLDDVDAHLAEHREDVLDLVGIDLFHQRVDLVLGEVPAFLGSADQRLQGRVRPVEQRALGTLLLQHIFLLRRYLGLACHEFHSRR
jgi:hypothetical protein